MRSLVHRLDHFPVKSDTIVRVKAAMLFPAQINVTQGERYDSRKRPETTVHNDVNIRLRYNHDRFR